MKIYPYCYVSIALEPTDLAIPATEEQMRANGYVRERTCRNLGGSDEAGMDVFDCSECGCALSLYLPDGSNNLCTGHVHDYLRYCPNCGAKVVG